MAYIGKEPAVGNFQVCDAISVVNGQAAYTLQVSSTNVVPESANHMLVSLNGILQKPNSSFTVSGSTITFASNLATGDVIDFIMLLGSVLDIGIPSDSSVTDAKANFVSTSSAAGLQIIGDGTTDGTLQLNCSQNSHGVKIASPAHSAGQSYTLTLPTGNVTADKFLKVASVSGSGTTGIGQLSFADAGGGLVLIKEVAASNVASVSFVHGTSDVVFDSTYKAYLFVFSQVMMASDEEVFIRAMISGSAQTSSYVNAQYGSYAGTSAYHDEYSNAFMGSPGDVESTRPLSGFAYVYGAGGSSIYPQMVGQVTMKRSNSNHYNFNFGAYRNATTSNFDGITFTNNGGGNISTGNFKLYGLK